MARRGKAARRGWQGKAGVAGQGAAGMRLGRQQAGRHGESRFGNMGHGNLSHALFLYKTSDYVKAFRVKVHWPDAKPSDIIEWARSLKVNGHGFDPALDSSNRRSNQGNGRFRNPNRHAHQARPSWRLNGRRGRPGLLGSFRLWPDSIQLAG